MLLAAGGALLLIYLLAIAWAGVPTSMQVDPKQVALQATQVTGYTLPAGYTERAATTIAGVERILIDDAQEQNTIWLISGFSAGSDTPDSELRQGITFPKYRNLDWQVQDSKSETIHGQEIGLSIYAGTGPDATQYQAWACAFQGNNGPAILVIAGPQASWSDAVAQAFIDSMH